MYEKRDYRKLYNSNLSFRTVTYEDTDLSIGLPQDKWYESLSREIEALIKYYRNDLNEYIKRDPEFLVTHKPHQFLPDAPQIAQGMTGAANLAGVGPMAAVAGAFASAIGRFLLPISNEVIVENGGDIFLAGNTDKTIGLFFGNHSPFNNKVALNIKKELLPLGVCTSSGTVGPSFSYGKADGVVILSPSVELADSVATASANLVQSAENLAKAVDFAKNIERVIGVLAVKDDKLAAWGKIELVALNE
mgnify:FL=1